MSAGEIITGSLAGVGTVAILYALRLMRRLVANVTAEFKAIVAAPAEVKELRAGLASNTEAIGNLSAALERLTRITEQRANGPLMLPSIPAADPALLPRGRPPPFGP